MFKEKWRKDDVFIAQRIWIKEDQMDYESDMGLSKDMPLIQER